MLLRLSSLLVLALRSANAAFDLGFNDDSDLTNFISRPEIKVPLFNITVYDADRVTPGYWFVAPYARITKERHPANYYQTCQSGPAIYDGSGNLVWTGACFFRNQNVCDFRAYRFNDTDYISGILTASDGDAKGHGFIMDGSYSTFGNIGIPKTHHAINMHELNVINDGRTALLIVHKSDWHDISELAEFGVEEEAGWVGNVGFQEIEVATGKILFEWWSLDHVAISESQVVIENHEGPFPKAWNFFHMNSVDKNDQGDYMISARFTDCIYKISGKDGSVLWRLGGDESDFVLDGFNFSRQHDARFVQQNETTTIISFLDNGADSYNQTSNTSSTLLVALDTSSAPMTARVLQRWWRPDGELSRLRGNFQMLSSGNVFASWSDNSYFSEHTADGELVMEAQFSSQRFVTYRSYKFNFTGTPPQPPEMVSQAYGTSVERSTTVSYVTWNGATEVESWNFHRPDGTLVGSVVKEGFETMFQADGFEPSLYAEAISTNGEFLGRSPVELTKAPRSWKLRQEFEAQNAEGETTTSWPLTKETEIPNKTEKPVVDYVQPILLDQDVGKTEL